MGHPFPWRTGGETSDVGRPPGAYLKGGMASLPRPVYSFELLGIVRTLALPTGVKKENDRYED